jgi:hypothetical protein
LAAGQYAVDRGKVASSGKSNLSEFLGVGTWKLVQKCGQEKPRSFVKNQVTVGQTGATNVL